MVAQSTQTKEPTDTRFLVLRGLPFALCDNPTDFYKVCFDSDDDYSFHHLDIGIILTEYEGDVLSSSLRLNPASLKIIIEGDFVMDSIEDLSKAMCILYGLTHCISTILNL
ncbi:hypothetical protein G5714_024336 [Onychostoma macrolepis]|uniref:Uncharacterized protein n=1 Tax=Onychostoma macrolepis TaxID=369639 RepID=A0A7J6BJQ7_9TELE|nr:hypothetical protein G5714_024336 [Onychostoma macrolepis]